MRPMTQNEQRELEARIPITVRAEDEDWLEQFDLQAQDAGFEFVDTPAECDCAHGAHYGHEPRCGYYIKS